MFLPEHNLVSNMSRPRVIRVLPRCVAIAGCANALGAERAKPLLPCLPYPVRVVFPLIPASAPAARKLALYFTIQVLIGPRAVQSYRPPLLESFFK